MNKKIIIWFINKLIQYLFEVIFFLFLFFFWLEYFKEGLVTNYFNFNLLWLALLIISISWAVLPSELSIKKRKHFFILIFWSLVGGILVYYSLPFANGIYKLVPIISGLAVYLGLKLVYDEI